MKRLRALTSLVCGAIAALTLGAASASADPTTNPNALQFRVVCPGMQPFDVTNVGAVGFAQGQRVLAIRQLPGQGSLDLVQCTATNPQIGTFTIFLQFVERG
jgi:hypothetical protein